MLFRSPIIMKHMSLIPLAAILLVGCTKVIDEEEEEQEVVVDDDGDGFALEDDCDDTDPDINPDAEEIIGDGVDSDCDGEDPNFDYVGDWDLASIVMADEEGRDVLEAYGDAAGSMEVSEDLVVSVETTHTYTDEGETFGLGVSLAGDATPLSEVSAFSLDLSGQIFAIGDDEALDVTGDWECSVDADTLSCSGETTATVGEQSLPLDTTASLTRQ